MNDHHISFRKGAFTVAQNFLKLARQAENDEALSGLMDDVSRELGFRYFALIHHVHLDRSHPWIIRIDNYPTDWANEFVDKQIFLEDPVLCASLRTPVGFSWSEVPNMIRMTPRHHQILEQAKRSGLGAGFTVPANVPGECHGSVSFATIPSRPLPKRNLPATQLIGLFAFEAARRNRIGSQPVRPVPSLSARQRECLVLVVRGKTDCEIAGILGLKEDSVKKYINAACKRYGVTKRAARHSSPLRRADQLRRSVFVSLTISPFGDIGGSPATCFSPDRPIGRVNEPTLWGHPLPGQQVAAGLDVR